MSNFLISQQNFKRINSPYTKLNNTVKLCNNYYMYHNFNTISIIDTSNQKFFFLGDIITNLKELKKKIRQHKLRFSPHLLRNIKGIFYLIISNIKEKKIEVYSSLFSLLPVFYTNYKDEIFIASNELLLREKIGVEKINKRFILEQVLFNYQLFNSTIFNNIYSVNSNSYVEITNNNFRIIKHTSIENYFPSNPRNWKNSINDLSNIFIDETKEYFPDENFYISFTSGFDGRTLVSCALNENKKFSTYSFGSSFYNDITIPKNNSYELGIDFLPILLDIDKYINEEFIKNGKEIVQLTSCQSSYIYSHFIYSSKILSQNSNYLIGGYFGSELLRAPHSSGAILSENILDFFSANNNDVWIYKIHNSDKLTFLQKEKFKDEIDSLISDMRTYKNNQSSELNRQQKLYIFLFEEALRKVFGNWIRAQSNFLKVRAPYINFNFVKELLNTELAGVNNSYLTNNPLKRYKGQTLYAEIIRKTSNTIYNQKTGKGYSPKDLMTTYGKFNIIKPYFEKRLKRKYLHSVKDILSINTSIYNNYGNRNKLFQFHPYFNEKTCNPYLSKMPYLKNERYRDIIILSISISEYLNNQEFQK